MQEVHCWQKEKQIKGQDWQNVDEKPPWGYDRGDSSLSRRGSSVEEEKWTDLRSWEAGLTLPGSRLNLGVMESERTQGVLA